VIHAAQAGKSLIRWKKSAIYFERLFS